MNKVVLTGGVGFIGSNLPEELVKKVEVIIIDNLSAGKMENIRNIIKKDNVELLNERITDLKFLDITFRDIDCNFHQAAIPSVPRSLALLINKKLIGGTHV
jgi:UDP-glucose 4-epimerase